MIEQAKFTYSRKKSSRKTKKKIEDQGLKQVEVVKALTPKEELKALKSEENQELESAEGTFPKNEKNK